MIDQGIFRQYDIRGIYGKTLTVEAAEGIGRAYAVILAEHGLRGAIAVGRDNRPSGGALCDALVRGLTASGVDVIDSGIVPTPLLYWALHNLPVVAGIQITGSHNPPEYNGFKCCVGTGSLHGAGILHLRDVINAGIFPKGEGKVSHEAMVFRMRGLFLAVSHPFRYGQPVPRRPLKGKRSGMPRVPPARRLSKEPGP